MQAIEQLLASFDMTTLFLVVTLWFAASVYLMYWGVRKLIERMEDSDIMETKTWMAPKPSEFWE